MPLRENLDAVIAVINDHYFAVIGDRDTVRVTETVLVAVHTFDECPVRWELEHAAVPVVAHVDVIVDVGSDAGRVLELIVALARRSHLEEIIAVRVEDLTKRRKKE